MINTPNFPIQTKLRYHDIGDGLFVIAIGQLGLATIEVDGDSFKWTCFGLDGGTDKMSKIGDVAKQINDYLMEIIADGSAKYPNMMKVH